MSKYQLLIADSDNVSIVGIKKLVPNFWEYKFKCFIPKTCNTNLG